MCEVVYIKIFLVRHGQSTANEKKEMAGHANVQLTDKGKKQAEVVAEKLKEEQIDMVFSSPLDRALETANIINSVRKDKLHINICNDLKEVNYGVYEGVKKSNFDYLQFWNYINDNNINNFFSFAWPIIKFIYKELFIKNYGKNILLVTHGGVSKVIEFILGDYSLNPDDLGNYLPDNSDLLVYNIAGDNTYFFHNEKSIEKESAEFFKVITPNIIGREYNKINKKLLDEIINLPVSDKPKIRNRVGIVLYNDNNEIAITKYSNTDESKIIGGSIDYTIGLENTIKQILDDRFGFSANFDTFKLLGTTIEIRPYDPLANINVSKIVCIKLDKVIHDLNPNEKEIEEGFSFEWMNIDDAIAELNSSFKKVHDYKEIPTKEYLRPILTKQSIVYRDLQVLEYYQNMILNSNYLD